MQSIEDLQYEDLRYNYDDSSDDEEESLEYKDVVIRAIEEIDEGLQSLEDSINTKCSDLEKLTGKKRKETEREGIRRGIKSAQAEVDALENFDYAYIMEMNGRQEIYKHLPKYREKKRNVLKPVAFGHDIEEDRDALLLKCNLGILEEIENMVLDGQVEVREFLAGENQFSLLRRLLRQVNSDTGTRRIHI